MEVSKRKPTIIEFNGLPGSGKTTMANLIKQLLSRECVEVFHRYYKKPIHQKTYTILANPKYWKLAAEIFSYCDNLPLSERLHYTISITGFVRMYHNFSKSRKQGLLLIDQGIVQSFISVAFQEQLRKSDKIIQIIKTSKLCSLPLLIVNCDVKTTISSERIDQRPPKNCRADSLNEKERQKLLNVQEKNFSVLRGTFKNPSFHINQISVNTEDSVETNAEKIIKEYNRLSQL